MSRLEEIIEYNKNFVDNKEYKEYVTTKTPKKKWQYYLAWILD